MKIIKIITLVAIIIGGLSSCDLYNQYYKRKPTNLEILSTSEPILKTKKSYNYYLALEYLQYSRSFYVAKKTSDGEYFAGKGIQAMNAEMLIPESPVKWKADKMQIEEMLLMQKRLEVVLGESHLKNDIPIQLAHLTYLYDCWISRESKEIFRNADLAYCKSRFGKLIDEIERYIDSEKAVAMQPKVEIKELEFERFEILFDAESVKLNSKAEMDIIAALKYITSLSDQYRVLVVGNADHPDLSIANKNLANNRAVIVRDYLTKNGINKSIIEMRLMGEDFPDVIAKDFENNQANRKVGIYVMKGVDSFTAVPLAAVKNDIYVKKVKEARKARGLD
jgi:outer membrane protein OmpA-like peptidoglycan-associated protein